MPMASHGQSRIKTPTPLRLTPGYDSMAASQQAHIDDLVQKNRTLEHTNKKLKDELARETGRSEDAVREMRQKWHTERKEWTEGCDTLQACHRLVQLRTAVELDKSRMDVLNELDVTRKEKIARLQRDFQITRFQARERELEFRVEELEDEVGALQVKIEEDVHALSERYKGQIKKLTAKCRELEDEHASRVGEIETVQQEKDALEDQLSQLQEQYKHLQAASDSTASKLERVTLQLEGALTKNAEVERRDEELQRTNADLKRQLDKWENLEKKGGAEVETLRKRRIELEVDIKGLEERLEDSEKREAELTKSLEKEKKKVERWKKDSQDKEAEIEQNQNEVAEAQRQLEKAQRQLEKAQRQREKSQKQLEKLELQLEAERKKVLDAEKRPQKKNGRAAEPEDERSSQEEEQVANAIGDVKSSSPVRAEAPTKPASKTKAAAKARPKPRPKRGNEKEPTLGENNAGPSGSQAQHDVIDASDVEEVQEVAKATHKGRDKAKVVAEDQDDDEIVQHVAPEAELLTKNKGKRKATSKEDSDLEIVQAPEPVKRKGKGRSVSEVPDVQKPKRGRGANRIESMQSVNDEDSGRGSRISVEGEHDQPPKKKKRKIAIFPAVNSESNLFAYLPQGKDGGLGIPTELSPVKDTDLIPNRSVSILGRMGSVLSGTFTRR